MAESTTLGHFRPNLGSVRPNAAGLGQTHANFGQILAMVNRIWLHSVRSRPKFSSARPIPGLFRPKFGRFWLNLGHARTNCGWFRPTLMPISPKLVQLMASSGLDQIGASFAQFRACLDTCCASFDQLWAGFPHCVGLPESCKVLVRPLFDAR